MAQNWEMYHEHTNLSPPTSIQAQMFSLSACPPSHTTHLALTCHITYSFFTFSGTDNALFISLGY